MFEARISDNGDLQLSGRFDASQVAAAQSVFEGIKHSIVVDCSGLTYISSAGLGVLLEVHRRLAELGAQLTLRNMNQSVRNVFRYSGLDRVLDIE